MKELTDKQARQAAEQLEEIGISILNHARSELYLGMRFLDVALSSFFYAASMKVDPVGTDGTVIFFQPVHLGGQSCLSAYGASLLVPPSVHKRRTGQGTVESGL